MLQMFNGALDPVCSKATLSFPENYITQNSRAYIMAISVKMPYPKVLSPFNLVMHFTLFCKDDVIFSVNILLYLPCISCKL